jgi:hypothetical protein
MKTHSIVAIFIALVVILAINPKMVNTLYSSVLGRLFLISIVILLSMKNVTLGLLVALTIISGLNQFGSFVEGSFVEGFEPTTVGEDNVDATGKQIVLTNAAQGTTLNQGTTGQGTAVTTVNSAKQKISDLKAQAAANGVDKEDIKAALQAKDSSTIPTDPNMTTNETVEAFTTNMLRPSSLTKGFYSAAPVS